MFPKVHFAPVKVLKANFIINLHLIHTMETKCASRWPNMTLNGPIFPSAGYYFLCSGSKNTGFQPSATVACISAFFLQISY